MSTEDRVIQLKPRKGAALGKVAGVREISWVTVDGEPCLYVVTKFDGEYVIPMHEVGEAGGETESVGVLEFEEKTGVSLALEREARHDGIVQRLVIRVPKRSMGVFRVCLDRLAESMSGEEGVVRGTPRPSKEEIGKEFFPKVETMPSVPSNPYSQSLPRSPNCDVIEEPRKQSRGVITKDAIARGCDERPISGSADENFGHLETIRRIEALERAVRALGGLL